MRIHNFVNSCRQFRRLPAFVSPGHTLAMVRTTMKAIPILTPRVLPSLSCTADFSRNIMQDDRPRLASGIVINLVFRENAAFNAIRIGCCGRY